MTGKQTYTCECCGHEYDRLDAVLSTTKHEPLYPELMPREPIIRYDKIDQICNEWVHSFKCKLCRSGVIKFTGDIIFDWDLIEKNPWLRKAPLFTHPSTQSMFSKF